MADVTIVEPDATEAAPRPHPPEGASRGTAAGGAGEEVRAERAPASEEQTGEGAERRSRPSDADVIADVIADGTGEVTEPADAPPSTRPAADGPEPDVPPRRPSGWALRMAGLAAALVVLAIVDVVLLARPVDPIAAQREPALAAARAVALDLSSIGAENAQERLGRLDAATTGPFREDLGGYAALLQDMLRQGGVRAQASVTAAGLERIDAETAVALVSVTATVTDTAAPQGEVRRYRLAIEMRREGDAWLASTVAYIP